MSQFYLMRVVSDGESHEVPGCFVRGHFSEDFRDDRFVESDDLLSFLLLHFLLVLKKTIFL